MIWACWRRFSALCIPSRGPRDFLASSAWKNWRTPAKTCLVCCAMARLAADRRIITGLLQLLDGLRFILKTIETEAGEGIGGDAALIGCLEELQAQEPKEAHTPAIHSRQKARAGAASCPVPAATTTSAAPPAPPAPAAEPVAAAHEPALRPLPNLRRSGCGRYQPAARTSIGSGDRRREHAARRRDVAKPHDEPGGRTGAHP